RAPSPGPSGRQASRPAPLWRRPGERGMLSAVSKILLRLLPGALLLTTVTIALHPSGLRDAAAPLVPAFPLTVLGGGLLLGWRFARSRLGLALAVLLLTDRALLMWAPVSGAGGEVGRAIFGALTLLVPADLAALAWLPERGVLARPGQVALVVLAAEVLLVALLCQPLFLPLAAWSEVPPPRVGLRALSQAALVVFAVAFLVVTWRVVLRVRALESGAVWTVVAAFLALGTGGGGLDSSLYLAPGGVILVLPLIETGDGRRDGGRSVPPPRSRRRGARLEPLPGHRWVDPRALADRDVARHGVRRRADRVAGGGGPPDR